MTRGERIKKAREEAGLSKSALAKRVGVSHTAIGQWENDETGDMGSERLKKLARALRVEESYLRDGTTPQHPDTNRVAEPGHTYSNPEDRALAAALSRLEPEDIPLLEDIVNLIHKARKLRAPR